MLTQFESFICMLGLGLIGSIFGIGMLIKRSYRKDQDFEAGRKYAHVCVSNESGDYKSLLISEIQSGRHNSDFNAGVQHVIDIISNVECYMGSFLTIAWEREHNKKVSISIDNDYGNTVDELHKNYNTHVHSGCSTGTVVSGHRFNVPDEPVICPLPEDLKAAHLKLINTSAPK